MFTVRTSSHNDRRPPTADLQNARQSQTLLRILPCATPPFHARIETMVRLGGRGVFDANSSSLQRQIMRPTNMHEAKKSAASNLRGEDGTNLTPLPLFDAIRAQNINKVKYLIQEEGKDVNEEDEEGITPLIEATLTRNEPMVQLIMEAGAPAQPPPGFRHTPLRAACLTGNVKLIEVLLAHGADPNAKSEGDRTPLMGACFLRPDYGDELSLPAVQAMLKDERTDVTITNSFGETATSLCKERGYSDSVKVLEKLALMQKRNED